MNDDDLWAAVDSQRQRIVEVLKELTPADWDHPSLCEGWRVRDVAAHLTKQPMTLRDVFKDLARHPGGVNHMIQAAAIGEANRRSTEQLTAGIAGLVGSRRHVVGVTVQMLLTDVVVHGQDIAMPLGLRIEVPPQIAATAASNVWAYQTTRKGRLLARIFRPLPYQSYRLVATDFDWSAGNGAEIRGPILAILLLLTGRTARYAELSGGGAAALKVILGSV